MTRVDAAGRSLARGGLVEARDFFSYLGCAT
jgi:hypothetical protein